jgi:hypothetical protein
VVGVLELASRPPDAAQFGDELRGRYPVPRLGLDRQLVPRPCGVMVDRQWLAVWLWWSSFGGQDDLPRNAAVLGPAQGGARVGQRVGRVDWCSEAAFGEQGE